MSSLIKQKASPTQNSDHCISYAVSQDTCLVDVNTASYVYRDNGNMVWKMSWGYSGHITAYKVSGAYEITDNNDSVE